MQYPPDKFTYTYLAGPVDTPAELENITEGNCRLAIQLYFYRVWGRFIQKDEIYLPGGYKTLGTFIFKEEAVNWSKARVGDIVYAQNIKKKDSTLYERDRDHYHTYDDWVYNFHTAIYVGENKFWHATSIVNGPAVWSREEFENYYKPISVKRLLL